MKGGDALMKLQKYFCVRELVDYYSFIKRKNNTACGNYNNHIVKSNKATKPIQRNNKIKSQSHDYKASSKM